MRRILREGLLVLAASTLAATLSAVPPVREGFAQQSGDPAPRRWEYCAITNAQTIIPRAGAGEDKFVGVASICYFQASGCRREEVRFDLEYSEFMKEAGGMPHPNYNRHAAGVRATEAVLSKAIVRLGDDGWEMVGENPIDFVTNAGGNPRNTAIYFKRPKLR